MAYTWQTWFKLYEPANAVLVLATVPTRKMMFPSAFFRSGAKCSSEQPAHTAARSERHKATFCILFTVYPFGTIS